MALSRISEALKLIKIVLYLLGWILLLAYLASIDLRGMLPLWLDSQVLIFRCALVGALGGVIYCLRAIYLNKSVKGQWNSDWDIWYFLRPLVSFLVGGVSYIFLKAGMLVLDAELDSSPSPYGFLALSFIAGLNVDRFLVKLEDVAKASWGIKPSRTSENSLSKEE